MKSIRVGLPLLAAACVAFAVTVHAFQAKIPISECEEGGSTPSRSCECLDMPKMEKMINTLKKNREAWQSVRARKPQCMAEANQWFSETATTAGEIINDLKACPDFKPIPEPNVCSSDSDCGSHGACYPTGGGGGGSVDVCAPSSGSGSGSGGTMACQPVFDLGHWDGDEGEAVVDPCYCKQMCEDIVQSTGVHEARHHWDYTWGMAIAAVQSLSIYLDKPGTPGVPMGLDQANANMMMGSEVNALNEQIDHLEGAISDFMNEVTGDDCTWETITKMTRPPPPPPAPTLPGRVQQLIHRVVNGARP